ncbi:MAG: bifunctional 5,10-methylenetetrahydrofolate dehydrogenase/5,10-methenyltetrahydrofolate cyclohydrolase [Elusimicrobia bacterium]|nr:bifunctional 5,10-methylenetetrahydrofolate dehydrogenase/5,10-methenyltetrahydrofolate cyclohydrolase [Elusimicrobiota bacterium]MDE2313954.1 bifunctional 5,10-methylenetetrahydrofolate dehydrogenase/5,10-methenyltetrahydrofolate cyclohydrolase [Elusimicrobiota bacterium]
MSAEILKGAALAAEIKEDAARRTAAFKTRAGRPIRLALISAQAGAAAQSYLKARVKAGQSVGIEAGIIPIGTDWTTERLAALIAGVARDETTDALIVDFPLPEAIDAGKIREALPPKKDAEGLSPDSFGRLFLAKRYAEARRLVVPPTAMACAELLRRTGIPLEGRRALVVGRSPVVGRPAAHLLSLLGLTVTLAHSKTQDIEQEVRRADAVVAAAGKARLVRGAWIKPGAAVIDAGVNQDGESLCGDVEFAAAAANASFITPVPGGVGPVTTACLLANAVLLAESRL